MGKHKWVNKVINKIYIIIINKIVTKKLENNKHLTTIKKKI